MAKRESNLKNVPLWNNLVRFLWYSEYPRNPIRSHIYILISSFPSFCLFIYICSRQLAKYITKVAVDLVKDGPLHLQEARTQFFHERGFEVKVNALGILETKSLFYLMHDITFELYMHVYFGINPVAYFSVIDELLDEKKGILKLLAMSRSEGALRIIESLHFLLMNQFPDIAIFPQLDITNIFEHQFPFQGILSY